MVDPLVVDLSRLQFALTALYHFLFVPLTLGLSILLAIMETVYVMTGRQVWRDMVKFWGTLFGINFVLGVATGITMEFQFGMNWAYYSHYVGDVFGAPLAIEGLMAFFLEATLVGLFFFGWNRMSKGAHCLVTWGVAFGTNLSALWILIANAWMQNPVGSAFNPETMRMEVVDFAAVLFNPVAQAKFVHTVSAGYLTAAVFVLGVSAFYLLMQRHREIARRSMTVAASFGLASALSVVVLGDESGYLHTEHQKMKLAAMEAEWETHAAPAPFNVVAWPDREEMKNEFALQVPWALGLIATRSVDEEVLGIKDLVDIAELRVAQGIQAYDAVQRLRVDPDDQLARDALAANDRFLGYGLLLKQFIADPREATPQQIRMAAESTIPNVTALFWSFRIMVGVGLYFILVTAIAFFLTARREHEKYPLFLKLLLVSIPLPWIAAELGWIVAEYGRQPWAIEGVLPTFLAASDLSVAGLLTTIAGFVLMYSALAVIEVWLLVKFIRMGPGYKPNMEDLLPDLGGGRGRQTQPAGDD